MFTKLHIEYADPADLHDSMIVTYRLRNTDIVERWVQKVLTAQARYPIDDPGRFYGFGSYADQVADAVQRINQCVTVINLYRPVIDRVLVDIQDQDTLNYLHSIFEQYHGLLDGQTTDFWYSAPDTVQQALADLNICVHRCESVARGADPRHVVTWYGLPKDTVLEPKDYSHSTDVWAAGTVFLNYAEIGKTLGDLARDNDKYIDPDAFRPFRHYSADFVVRFYEQTELQAEKKRATIIEYYNKSHWVFGSWQTCFADVNVPVADIVDQVSLESLETRQYVKSVSFT
jgi:hypothetical protein